MSPVLLNELPQSPLAPAPASAPLAVSARFPASVRHVYRALSVLLLLLIVIWAVVNWRDMYDGAIRLSSADPGWLLLAAVCTCLCWVAASFARQGALPERLPPGLLLASQFAAGAANHVLPAGLGAHAVTLRFLQGRGIPLARATASLALYSLVKPVAGLLLLLTLCVASPGTLRQAGLILDGWALVVTMGGVTAGLAAVVVLSVSLPAVRHRTLGHLRTALTDARRLHTRPSRVLALWGGAAAFPLLQASALASVGAALGLSLAWPHVVFAYLAARAAFGAVPTPGGIGLVDAALVFSLAAFGAPTALATTTVIGYRVLVDWLPLLPGACVLSALARSKVL